MNRLGNLAQRQTNSLGHSTCPYVVNYSYVFEDKMQMIGDNPIGGNGERSQLLPLFAWHGPLLQYRRLRSKELLERHNVSMVWSRPE